jgi:hypothetical protein
MDIEKALKLTSSKELKEALVEAETRNVEQHIVRELHRRYLAAVDKEHQKAAMRKLGESLREPVKVNYIKVNTIADKAVSTMHGFTKMVKKADMDEGMLRDREPVLADTVELMAVNERLELGLSVSWAVYRKYCTLPVGKTA